MKSTEVKSEIAKDEQTSIPAISEESSVNDSVSSQLSLGAQLKAARDKARLSIGEVSKELLITKTRLTALESDDFAQLPAKVFVIGYIKKYADLLNLDDKALLNLYEASCSAEKLDDDSVVTSQSNSKVTLNKNVFSSQRSAPKWILPFSVFGVAALVLFGTIFFTEEKDKPQSPEKLKTIVNQTIEKNIQEQAITTNANAEKKSELTVDKEIANQVDEKAIDSVVSSEMSLSTSKSSDTSDVPLISQVTDQVENQAEGIVTEKELQASVAAEQESILNDAEELELTATFESPKKIDTLVFSFDEECWLNVKEVEGNVIYSGTASAGSQLTLEGRGPFELMVGNADSTSLLVNGESISIEAQRGRKTARLSVGG